jgi:3-oxoacyl-(acyl-carrier-protein) synthase
LSRPAETAVITGCGVVSPFGTGVRALWDGLVAGRTAIAPIRGFAAGDLVPNVAAEVAGCGAGDTDRAGAFALAAAAEAVVDAGLGRPPAEAGVALGTTLGGMLVFEAWEGAAVPGLDAVPYFAPGARLARAHGVHGPVATPQLACASGTFAVALAVEWVRRGRAPVVLAGGTDLLCRFVVAGFNCLRATAPEARPFDRARRGLVLGEGAAVVVVESAAHAAARGARVQARVLGVGAAADATHMTAPDREGGGASRALAAALADAGVAPAAVGFVSAHGTGTPYNDAMEAVAIARVFGAGGVPVNSIKGAVGHTLGAAGALETVMCTRVLAEGVIPPTAGRVDGDPACATLDLVRGAPRRHAATVVASTSSGFAGTNAALVLGAP